MTEGPFPPPPKEGWEWNCRQNHPYPIHGNRGHGAWTKASGFCCRNGSWLKASSVPSRRHSPSGAFLSRHHDPTAYVSAHHFVSVIAGNFHSEPAAARSYGQAFPEALLHVPCQPCVRQKVRQATLIFPWNSYRNNGQPKAPALFHGASVVRPKPISFQIHDRPCHSFLYHKDTHFQ